MTTHLPRTILDDRELWTLPAGSKVRELNSPRRELIVSPYSHQWLWHGEHPVPINDIEMPVEVIA
ncbi:hypothetical protein K3M35_05280 [Rhodococcus sp. DMU2021]|uniref:hypothetical protein n=1 Tax=Rhodococcus sp. DMU2021 TaxID=2866997 RepID=UPI001C7D5FA4|nr:hypothetical protein [Rhodococcus sp. DMU2021]MBX4168079.1 hypothetical protein [Rhodococcus sp. DMU2021]